MIERVVWQDAFGDLSLDPERELTLVRRVAERQFDAVFIFTSFSQTPYPPAYLCYLAGIPIRVAQTRFFGGSLLSHCVEPPSDSTHQALRNINLVEGVGLSVNDHALALTVPPEVKSSVDAILCETVPSDAPTYIALAPGASCGARRYDQRKFLDSATRLSELSGIPTVILGSERETELLSCIEERTLPDYVVSLVGRTTVPEFAEVIRRAALVIGNDSSAMHFADTFRRPMVILFSGTDLEEQWRPRAADAVLLRRETECAPCYQFKCPYNMECLDFSPEEIVGAAMKLLRSTERLSLVSPEIAPHAMRSSRPSLIG